MTRRVELVYFSGCPHVEAARAALRAALQAIGLTPTWDEWDQDAPETPARMRAYGSPTVLIDGRNVCSGTGPCAGRACRIDGLPSIEEIRWALTSQVAE